MSADPEDVGAPSTGIAGQLARLGFSTLVPISVWRFDRPWTIRSVQWFLFFTLFPLFLVGWTSVAHSDFRDVTYLFAIYFATTWGLVIWLFVRPERIGVLDIARVSLFTSITGVFLVGLLNTLPGLRQLVGAAQDAGFLRRLVGTVLGVGVSEELVKAIPLLWMFVRSREPGTVREITYLGCVSGFAFGVSEAVAYSIFYAQNVVRGDMPLGVYMVVQLTRLITLPLLHAVFSGIAGLFIALGVETPRLRRALIFAGIAIAALLHGLYDVFANTVLGFVLAVSAVLLFIAYVRSIDAMRSAVRSASVS
ncbi:MAG: PrsW family glutamic-type intramembrane protease [Myxococcota bacterium]